MPKGPDEGIKRLAKRGGRLGPIEKPGEMRSLFDECKLLRDHRRGQERKFGIASVVAFYILAILSGFHVCLAAARYAKRCRRSS